VHTDHKVADGNPSVVYFVTVSAELSDLRCIKRVVSAQDRIRLFASCARTSGKES
jgi:hypothetical protein